MPAPDYTTLYKFEPLLSQTIEALFNSDAIKSIGTPEAADDLQKDRPRVEVALVVGSHFGGNYVVTADGIRRENGWSGILHLQCITAPDAALHYAYLAAVRELAARLDRLDLTNTKVVQPTLDYHEITRLTTSGTAPDIKPEEGYYSSILSYEIIFAIRADAWPGGLNNNQPLT